MPEPALVLVIDDMGQKLEPAEQLASLPFPVALALWPHAAARRPVQQVARDMGLDVLLHMPMEAMPRKNGTAPNPGPGRWRRTWTPMPWNTLWTRRWRRCPRPWASTIIWVPGSPDGAMPAACWPVWPTGAACSCWTASPAATASWRPAWSARASSRPAAMFFLDDPQGTDKVLAALDKAARLARKQGIAIAIGHPHASTLRALERWENREGVAVVPLRHYVWHLAQLRAGQFGKPE